ncbi:MAG TPA: transcriptional regulator GcvA [Alphaproteobacteria bacterium]|nr:transcriptional regulator GcvA [Alphaproteobacteria bacterium]
MAQSLPPLNALRAFEAAARHLSFTKAADELHVTQAAISHQVKGLEDHLGVKLFRRLTRSLLLTEEGKALLPDLRAAFDQMTQAVQRVRVRGGQRTLNISTMTTFAMSWLVPRLPNFQAAHPDIEVRISTTQRLVDFAREDVDLATRYGFGSWPGLASHKLFDDVLTPLCSPAIAAKLIRPEDLRGVTLLHENPEPSDWTFWSAKFGVEGIDGRKGPRFDSTRIAVQAAIGGLGVAIGAPNVFIEELATGRLVQPFPEMVVGNGKAFWIVYLETSADEPKIRAFRDWILAEATAMRPPPVERLPRI